MRRLLSVNYKPACELPVEIRMDRGKGISRLYLTESEARDLRALLDNLPEDVARRLPREIPARALAPWPKAARF